MSSEKSDEVKRWIVKGRQVRVLVTGATAGIGAASAIALAEAGYEVIVHGRNEARCAPIVEAIQAKGGTVSVRDRRFFVIGPRCAPWRTGWHCRK